MPLSWSNMAWARLVFVLVGLASFLVLFGALSALYSSSTATAPAPAPASPRSPPASRLGTLFFFRSPSSFFPSSAIVSLTDDNSTFFLARPAAFGPVLPPESLSGPLWVGGTFAEDDVAPRDDLEADAHGELGCGDVPGWEDRRQRPGRHPFVEPSTETSDLSRPRGSLHRTDAHHRADARHHPSPDSETRHGRFITGSSVDLDDEAAPDDGTDDHLHWPLPESNLAGPASAGRAPRRESDPPATTTTTTTAANHADIQSIQESAEIAGKVVLLARGGCGFLEKAKWVQRRGGLALIVGDDTRGGSLVTMYARGDTSNITIPSLFTSHTTAHLLSSLMPVGVPPVQGGWTDARKVLGRIQDSNHKDDNNNNNNKDEDQKHRMLAHGPTSTPAVEPSSSRSTAHPGQREGAARRVGLDLTDPSSRTETHPSFIRRLFAALGRRPGRSSSGSPPPDGADSRRPPISGRLDWRAVVVRDGTCSRPSVPTGTPASLSMPQRSTTEEGNGAVEANRNAQTDDFVIGVQDWRDPDILHHDDVPRDDTTTTTTTTTSGRRPLTASSGGHVGTSSNVAGPMAAPVDHVLTGGIITPGSGEYMASEPDPKTTGTASSSSGPNDAHPVDCRPGGSDHHRWLGGLSWPGRVRRHAHDRHEPTSRPLPTGSIRPSSGEAGRPHEGLWVTLTPTGISGSPFFDSLLVLVVSPLVTLTIVYAMLLVRSRVRRRRWRAPKSVVERLPVRTYHTLPTRSSAGSVRYGTTHSSSAASPLLRPTAWVPTRSSGRSPTTADASAQTSIARSWPVGAHDASVVLPSAHLLPTLGGPVVGRRYRGGQVECVVCLEEYVDGVSRVMSLPCGHEFHAECMYVRSSYHPSSKVDSSSSSRIGRRG